MNEAQTFDEIDRIVDEVIENHIKAAKLKRILHTKHVTDRFSAKPRHPTYEEVADDFWDNVPV